MSVTYEKIQGETSAYRVYSAERLIGRVFKSTWGSQLLWRTLDANGDFIWNAATRREATQRLIKRARKLAMKVWSRPVVTETTIPRPVAISNEEIQQKRIDQLLAKLPSADVREDRAGTDPASTTLITCYHEGRAVFVAQRHKHWGRSTVQWRIYDTQGHPLMTAYTRLGAHIRMLNRLCRDLKQAADVGRSAWVA